MTEEFSIERTPNNPKAHNKISAPTFFVGRKQLGHINPKYNHNSRIKKSHDPFDPCLHPNIWRQNQSQQQYHQSHQQISQGKSSFNWL